MRIELWAYDEYNQGSIVASSNSIEDVVKKAKQFVSEVNVDNALAAGEKDKSWEAHFPQVFKGKAASSDVLYAGNKRDGSHTAWVKDKKGKWAVAPLPKDAKVRFFLGEIPKGKEKEQWYLANHRGEVITSLDDQSLERKTVLFVKITN